ncbi:MAG: hypothetical protein ABEK50_00340 [bacterium]
MDSGRIGDELRGVIDWLETQTVLDDEFAENCWNRLKAVERIRATNRIETACMKPFSNGKYVIYLNLDFLERNVFEENPLSNFSFVLLHEVLHRERRDGTRKVLGLERRWSGVFKNYVLDVFVNSTLYRRGFPPTETVTKQLYNATSLSFLLLPPHHLLDEINQVSSDRIESPVKSLGTKPYPDLPDGNEFRKCFRDNVEEPLSQSLNESMDRDWCRPNGSFDRLMNCYMNAWFDRPSLKQVAKTLNELINGTPIVQALGSHGGTRGGSGRGEEGTEEIELDPRWKRTVNEFVRIVKKALVESDKATIRRQKRTSQRGIRPSMDRRSSYLMASRTWPVFFENTIEARHQTREAAYIYVVSSGSMSDEMVQLISSLVLGADDYIANPIYLFTTEVKPVKLKELRSGLRLSGGTKINAPLDHAREKGLEQLIVITDGYVEEIKPKNQAYLEESDLFTLFNYDAQDPLQEHSTEYWEHIEDMIGVRTR